jgi:hypothetical protein
MVVAGMALIGPVMVRLFINVLGVNPPLGSLLGISPNYLILITLIILERKAKSGRWVFPCALGLFLFVHIVKTFKITYQFGIPSRIGLFRFPSPSDHGCHSLTTITEHPLLPTP